ncbi:MAG: SpoIIE family protein phosphatase [Eubacterium sp.]|nr:SpoIIE family protein phosphatase [Eubacterium sp.]
MKYIRDHARVKSILGIVLFLLIFAVIVSVIGFRSFSEAIMEQYAEGAFMTADAAVQMIEGDKMEDYASSGGKTEEYKAAWDQLDKLCNSSGSTFVYVIQPDRTDYAHITFIFSTINHDSDYSVYDFGFVRDTTNDEYREKYRKLYDKESEHELVIRDKGYIETDPHITAMTSILDSNGDVVGILCVQRQMDAMVRVRQNWLKTVLFATFVLVLIIIVVQSMFLGSTLLKPIELISEEATRFAKENVVRDEKLTDVIHNTDEIGKLAGSIDKMEEQVQSYIDNITQITAEKERIKTELSLATKIQADMLPNIFPAFPERTEFDIYAAMDPARAVGGDFYDFFLVDDDHLGIVIADVSGKGIPAALFMMASKIIISNYAKAGKPPAQVLTEANEAICSNNREEMFVTVWLGILELSTGRIKASNAAHEYPAIRKPGGEFELVKDKHGFVLGGLRGMKYSEYELQMEPGSRLFLYTDGIPEATSADKELFGTDRMIEALNVDPDTDPEDTITAVRKAVDGFVKDAEQFDDMTMLCMEYKGK